MGTKLTNNATGRLAVSLTAASTQLSMVVGDAVKFPTIAAGSGDNFPLTAVKANGELEIMLCTLTNGNVFTVQRGQEGTSPKAFSAGDRIELRLTAGTVDGMIDDRIDAAIEVVLDDLGTAAYKDVGTSSDNVMEVGAGGWLSTIGDNLETLDSTTAINSVSRIIAGGGANASGWASGFGTALIMKRNSEHGTIIEGASGKLWFNTLHQGVLSGWNEIYHKNNFPPIGFVYTQYPGEATPSELFGGTWSLIFNTEGVAFRTEGGGASAFGSGVQGSALGSHAHTASSNSSGAHTHNTSGTAASAGGHSHTASTNWTGDHSHGGSAASAGEHTHGSGISTATRGTVKSITDNTGNERSQINTSSAGAHTHSLSINSGGGHSHTVSVGSGGAHTHSVSGTAASAGAHSHTITVNATGEAETRMTNRTIRVWKRTA